MSKKQEQWFVMWADANDPSGIDMLGRRFLEYEHATENAVDSADQRGSLQYICRAVAIVRPPPVQAPVVERLPGAPRKRKKKADAATSTGAAVPSNAEARNPGDEAVDFTPETWTTEPLHDVVGKATSMFGYRVYVDKGDEPPAPSLATEVRESFPEGHPMKAVDDAILGVIDQPRTTCPLCASGSAPARGMHTNAKGKRHRCPDARKEKAQ